MPRAALTVLAAALGLATNAQTAHAQFTFTAITGGDLSTPVLSWGISWVDFDGDGDLDLFASRSPTTGGHALLRNDGGTFLLTSAGALTDPGSPGSLGHTWADFDNDGDLDVLTAGQQGRLYRNDGGTFTVVTEGPLAPSAGIRGWAASWGDFDADGWLDAVVAHPAGFVGAPAQPNHLFRGIGAGSFVRVDGSPVTEGLAPYTVPAWSDFDLDGDLDLFIGSGPANGSYAPDFLYEYQAGTFSRIVTPPIATDPRDGQVMNWVDIDNDRDLDLCVSNYNNLPVFLYRNDDGAYVRITEGPLVTDIPGQGLANTWGDLDNDGDLDVVITGVGVDRLYRNDGAGGFESGGALANGPTSGATLGDYDNDGDLDLAISSPPPGGGAFRLYRNDNANGNHWLALDLAGTTDNRAAIGAIVWVRAVIGGTAIWQHREVSAQNTFNGQNALSVHVGLGDAVAVDTLRIVWPDGSTDEAVGLPVDQRLTVVQGVTPSAEPAGRQPALRLEAPAPHPIRRVASIAFSLAEPGLAHLDVLDVYGRVISVIDRRVRPAGRHVVQWHTEAGGLPVRAGAYLLRLRAAGGQATRAIVVTR